MIAQTAPLNVTARVGMTCLVRDENLARPFRYLIDELIDIADEAMSCAKRAEAIRLEPLTTANSKRHTPLAQHP